jgi:integrase
MARPPKMPSGLEKRAGAYYSNFRAAGRRIRKRLSTDFRTACELLTELRARADRGDFGLLDNDCKWSELRAEFLQWARQSVRRPGEYEADLKRFEKFMQMQSVRQMSQAVVLAYREWRLGQSIVVHSRKANAAPLARTVSPRSVNREVGTLNNMLNKGVEWGRIGSNPLAGLKPLRHDKPVKQRRSLNVEEIDRLFANSPAYLLPAWRTFACTGLRLKELADLRFSDIDVERQTLTVRAEVAKSKKAREIPLDDALLAMLVELKGRAGERQPVAGKTEAETVDQAARFSRDHVFVTTANTPHRSGLLKLFYGACKRAGIDDAGSGGSVDLHSLRVSFTTLALENGASPKAVQAILGHATLGMTMNVYAKATERAKRDAITALPFATSSAPAHIVSVHSGRKVAASNFESSQHNGSQRLALAGG